ncbi:MAG: hypothetical protein LBE58_13985 [Comamonas sp.]|jgi:iron complex outermembrane receptor protein|nr:hypothetical protein [Comamonas sp.]
MAARAGPLQLVDAVVDFPYQQYLQYLPLRFALNAMNLVNKRYLSACTRVCWYSAARNVTLTARVNWSPQPLPIQPWRQTGG